MVNGIDVAPLVNAELNRRNPERIKMRPNDPAGFRTGWDSVEKLWGATVERARELDPRLPHESVDAEWSFSETPRHLVFATDASPRTDTRPVPGTRWPEPRGHPVCECLLCILNEEWERRTYAERDLAILATRQA
ncbi:MAG: hypothetical protein ACRD0P_22850 [Stackebrandtia sp.]